MAAEMEASLGFGRSASLDARENGLSRSDSQRRSTGGGGRRRASRSGNEPFVCFAPKTSVHLMSRPGISPARDKGKAASSIFSKHGVKKQGFVAEEPTSPKVTCVGQVRVKHKKRKQSKGGSTRRRPACPSFSRDFSCLRFFCDSSLFSFRGERKKNAEGAVCAKSLVLIQQESQENKRGFVKQQQLEAVFENSKLTTFHIGGEGEHGAITVKEVEKKDLLESNIASNVKETEPVAISQTVMADEEDSFEMEPPPSNALLLMHQKVILASPALRRSTSAPVQSRSNDKEEGHKQTEPTSNRRSFFKRCKSASQSLTRCSTSLGSSHPKIGSSHPKVNPSKEQQVEVSHERSMNLHEEKPVEEKITMNVGKSESESMKVSLDCVPETWLWESYTIMRHPRSKKKVLCKKELGADAELEASLRRSLKISCGVMKDEEDSCSSAGNMPNTAEASMGIEVTEEKHEMAHLGRSSSVGSRGGIHFERGGTLWRSLSAGSLERRGYLSRSGRVGDNIGKPVLQVLERGGVNCEVSIESMKKSGSQLDNRELERAMLTPAPFPSSDATLFLRCSLDGTFQISLDAAEHLLKCIDSKGGENPQACMLKAVSDLRREIGPYACLLKASSGKEHASLTSVIVFQRCKSEPWRVAPYEFL